MIPTTGDKSMDSTQVPDMANTAQQTASPGNKVGPSDPGGGTLITEKEREYFRRLEFEHELIGRRIGWLLQSQTILLAAYGFSVGDKVASAAPLITTWVPIVGLSVSLAVLAGVCAGLLAKYHTWKDFKQKDWGVRTYVTLIGLLPDLILPVIFAVVWGVLKWGPP